MATLRLMQPLSAHHRIERTEQGERAWREMAMEPAERGVLGALRAPALVGDLLRTGRWAPSELEGLVNRMGRMGWVQVHQPAAPEESAAVDLEKEMSPEIDDPNVLAELLLRHRQEQEEEAARQEEALRPCSLPEVAVPLPSVHPAAVTPARQREPAAAVALEPVRADPLPFDRQVAESDGLMAALRNPAGAVIPTEHVTEWAPPSGGLAALLRALGEPVPEGVELSPDQREHMHDLAPVTPWGAAPSSPAPEVPRRDFVRLRDQPEDTTPAPAPAKPRLDALRGSLGKVQQERAEADAVRARARAIREQREQEALKVNEQRQAQRKVEDRRREGSTFLGLSQKLAKVKDKSNREE